MTFKYLKISPPSYSRFSDIYAPLENLRLDGIALHQKLLSGKDFNWESLCIERIANHPDPGSEKGREEATEKINSEVARDICELLNCLIGVAGEISEEASFQLVEEKDDEYEDLD